MRVAIVGFGYVGSQLADRLVAAGHDVFGVKRSQLSHPSVTGIQADVTDPSSLTALPPALDRVIYAVSPGAREDEAYRLAYPIGLGNLLSACPQARFIFVSSTAVYAQKNGETVDEMSATEATNFSSQRLLEAESILHQADPKHVIVRSSGIYGEGRTRLVTQLALDDLDQETRQIATSRIHRNDLAACLAYLSESSHPQDLYVASDPQPATLGEMQDWVRKELGGQTLPKLGRVAEALTKNRANRRLIPRRLIDEGFCFQYPSFREGYRDALSDFLAH